MMGSSKDEIWKKDGLTGIFTLPSTKGSFLSDPDFVEYGLLEECFSDPGLKAVIVRGSGRHFSAGADMGSLRELVRQEKILERKMRAGKDLLQLIANTPLPVVAEISGACFGGGLEIALACHIRICSENALFAFPEANHGIMPGLGGTITLSKLIGPGRATQMILSGDIVNAEKALETGLVDHVVPKETLHGFTLHYLEKLTRDRDVEVIRSIMRSIHNAMNMDAGQALEEETRLFCELALKNLGE